MSETASKDFTLGQHEARLDALETNTKEISADVKKILEIMNRGKGSWKTLVWLGGAVVGVVEILEAAKGVFHIGGHS